MSNRWNKAQRKKLILRTGMKKKKTGKIMSSTPVKNSENSDMQPEYIIDLRYPTTLSSSLTREKRFELEFLDKHVFKGLKNLNDGFDAAGIKYFNSSEFKIVLDRVEELGLGIYGIEPWKDGEFFWVETYEDSGFSHTDPRWYRKSFEEFLAMDDDLQYAASYWIPEKYFEEE